MLKITKIALSILFSTCLFGQSETGDVLIKNGTLLTITQGDKENTDILIRNGKIARIQKDIQPTNDIKVIDATGMFVMPGIIDAHSHIGIDAVNEATNPVTAEVWVGDALDPYDINIYRALAGGVTISHAMHGSANAIGGQCETIKHRWGVEDPEQMRMKDAPKTIKFALGENPIRVHGEGSRIVPNTRMGMEQVFRNAFEDGKKYAAEWDQYSKGLSKMAPEYNIRKETLAGILSGEIMIHCHSYRADEILMLMNVLEDYGVNKICFQHVNEGFKVAPELAKFGAYASVFSDWWAYKFEVYYSTAYNAAILSKNGVVTSINSDSRELIRHLFHEAAKTQKYGNLSDNDALKLITFNPAIQLGIDDRVGSLEKNKEGDVAIFKNHPLSIYAIPQYTIVDGIIRFDINNDNADMRIDIDPEEIIPSFFESSTHNHDNCMEGVSEFLFEHKH
ncbi:MAG: amidohydrolase family protein [Saprospiraceae bacterium]|nr:amidohydrolase family protein [Saprospiraceae bacterium]